MLGNDNECYRFARTCIKYLPGSVTKVCICQEMTVNAIDICLPGNDSEYYRFARTCIQYLPGGVTAVCESHVSDSQLVKHSEVCQAAVNSVASLQAHHTSDLVVPVGIQYT